MTDACVKPVWGWGSWGPPATGRQPAGPEGLHLSELMTVYCVGLYGPGPVVSFGDSWGSDMKNGAP